MALLGNVACARFPGQIGRSSGTRDKVNKSGTVPEIPGQLEPMIYMLTGPGWSWKDHTDWY